MGFGKIDIKTFKYCLLYPFYPYMGRIKTTLVKRTGKRLIEENFDKFSKDFGHNKKKVREFVDIPSKKIRNVVAGYLVRLTKKNK